MPVLVYVYMLMREASLKQRILCVMRTSIFGPFQREESAHYTQANTGVRQSSAQGLHGCRRHKALDTKSLKFATWQSLKKKKLACVGIISSSPYRPSETSVPPDQHIHRSDTQQINQCPTAIKCLPK